LKKLAFLGGAIGVGIGALVVAHSTQAADHIDSPAAIANPMADIGDVYTWMTPDALKVNLVMTVSPADPGTRHFDNTVQYVFHVNSSAGFMAGTATETKVICTFASDTDAQCWIGDKDYVKGNPSTMSGMTSDDGKVKVFAGRRSDPFFFNLNGYKNAVAGVEAAIANNQITSMTAAGCPHISAPMGAQLRGALQQGAGATAHAPCGSADADCFANFDVMAIVLQVDKTLLNDGTNKTLGVWASTHAAM
jgi:hypothetical protein